jgi:hypothetical protein
MRNRFSRSDWPAIVHARICLSQGTMIVGLAPAILCLAMVIVSSAVAQSAPISWNRPWHSSEEQQFVRDAAAIYVHELPDNPVKTYSLAELVDLAESNNPATRVAWERARARAASLGVAESELYPTLAAAALSRTLRDTIFFGNQFYWQRIQDFEVALDLSYTILDFGARRGRINAAKAQLLATNFEFNDTHRNVIYQVEQSYYRVLSSMGQEDAAVSPTQKLSRKQQRIGLLTDWPLCPTYSRPEAPPPKLSMICNLLLEWSRSLGGTWQQR